MRKKKREIMMTKMLIMRKEGKSSVYLIIFSLDVSLFNVRGCIKCGGKHKESVHDIENAHTCTHTHSGRGRFWRWCADSETNNVTFKAALGNFTCQQLQVETMCNFFKSRLNLPRTHVMLRQKNCQLHIVVCFPSWIRAGKTVWGSAFFGQLFKFYVLILHFLISCQWKQDNQNLI